jgi:integrase
MRKDLIKTKFPGVYYEQDSQTKVKTYIARIKIVNIIDTEQIVGYSNDVIRTNPSIAYEKRNELINKIKNGESIKKASNPKLEDFFDTYKEYKKNLITPNRLYIYTCIFNKHVPDKLKSKKIKDIQKDDIQKIVNVMMEKNYKPKTLYAIKDLFSPLFNYGIEVGMLDTNAAKNLKFPKFDQNRYFTLDESKAKALYKAILELPDNQYRAMFLFLLRGRRAGEVLSLEWQQLNFKTKRYTINDSQSKIRKTLTFVIDDELIEALECLEVQDEGLIFKNKKTNQRFKSFPQYPWQKLKEKCDIQDMKLHDFRHLFGFTLVNNGVSLENISRALGHSKITTTQMYSNQKEQMASEAVNAYLDLMK